MSEFREIMKIWLADRYKKLSLWEWHSAMEYTIIYFEGFRIGWIENEEFALGTGGKHPSAIYGFVKLCPADPQLFDKIKDRYRQIGVV